jgi:hypothetical protein
MYLPKLPIGFRFVRGILHIYANFGNRQGESAHTIVCLHNNNAKLGNSVILDVRFNNGFKTIKFIDLELAF